LAVNKISHISIHSTEPNVKQDAGSVENSKKASEEGASEVASEVGENEVASELHQEPQFSSSPSSLKKQRSEENLLSDSEIPEEEIKSKTHSLAVNKISHISIHSTEPNVKQDEGSVGNSEANPTQEELDLSDQYVEASEEEIESKKHLVEVYPNPFATAFSLSNEEMIESVSLYGMDGKIHFENRNKYNYTNGLDALPDGFYLVKIITHKQIVFKKIQKRHE
jgi:hypothetical protein